MLYVQLTKLVSPEQTINVRGNDDDDGGRGGGEENDDDKMEVSTF